MTRADGGGREYDWSPRAALLNSGAFRIHAPRPIRLAAGRRHLIPALPNSFTLPIRRRVTSRSAPTSGSECPFDYSVTEFVDTAPRRARRHTIKFGDRLRREALDVLNPPNPAGVYSFNAAATGTRLRRCCSDM